MKTVLSFDDYRACLRHFFLETGARGTLSRAADYMGVQRSHMSRVLNGELHLTLDQAYLAADFMGWKDDERAYFQLLVEHARASNERYRKSLQERLKQIAESKETKDKASTRADIVEVPKLAHYFSSWTYSAVHVATMADARRTPVEIAERLRLPKRLVQKTLQELSRAELVESEGPEYVFKSGDVHLSRRSPFVVGHHANWRNRAVEDAQSFDERSLHYTLVQVIDEDSYRRIRALLVDAIADANKVSDVAGKSRLMNLNVDAFLVDE